MLRAWTIFFALAMTLWIERVVMWTHSGSFSPLTVGDLLTDLGFSLRAPPATDLGDLAARVLGTDGGFFFFFLTLGALALDAMTSRRH